MLPPDRNVFPALIGTVEGRDVAGLGRVDLEDESEVHPLNLEDTTPTARGYGLFEQLGAPASDLRIAAAMPVLYAVATLVGTWRYR